MVETDGVPVAAVQLTEEEKNAAREEFERIIYSNLEQILAKRPAFPVTKFAKAILEDVDLDENGDPILKKKKKKDKKKKDKKGGGKKGKDKDKEPKDDKKKQERKKDDKKKSKDASAV